MFAWDEPFTCGGEDASGFDKTVGLIGGNRLLTGDLLVMALNG
jgi:hypothetical protein